MPRAGAAHHSPHFSMFHTESIGTVWAICVAMIYIYTTVYYLHTLHIINNNNKLRLFDTDIQSQFI